MRGTIFENISVINAAFEKKYYKKHQQKLKKIQPQIISSEQINHSINLINDLFDKKDLRKNFEEKQAQEKINNVNERLLHRFFEIKKGRKLSVGFADYTRNFGSVQNSPVFEQHSLKFVERKNWLNKVDRDNRKMVVLIDNPNSTVKIKELKSNWLKNIKLKGMLSKSKIYNFDQNIDISKNELQRSFQSKNQDAQNKQMNEVESQLEEQNLSPEKKVTSENIQARNENQKLLDISQSKGILSSKNLNYSFQNILKDEKYVQALMDSVKKIQLPTDQMRKLQKNQQILLKNQSSSPTLRNQENVLSKKSLGINNFQNRKSIANYNMNKIVSRHNSLINFVNEQQQIEGVIQIGGDTKYNQMSKNILLKNNFESPQADHQQSGIFSGFFSGNNQTQDFKSNNLEFQKQIQKPEIDLKQNLELIKAKEQGIKNKLEIKDKYKRIYNKQNLKLQTNSTQNTSFQNLHSPLQQKMNQNFELKSIIDGENKLKFQFGTVTFQSQFGQNHLSLSTRNQSISNNIVKNEQFDKMKPKKLLKINNENHSFSQEQQNIRLNTQNNDQNNYQNNHQKLLRTLQNDNSQYNLFPPIHQIHPINQINKSEFLITASDNLDQKTVLQKQNYLNNNQHILLQKQNFNQQSRTNISQSPNLQKNFSFMNDVNLQNFQELQLNRKQSKIEHLCDPYIGKIPYMPDISKILKFRHQHYINQPQKVFNQIQEAKILKRQGSKSHFSQINQTQDSQINNSDDSDNVIKQIKLIGQTQKTGEFGRHIKFLSDQNTPQQNVDFVKNLPLSVDMRDSRNSSLDSDEKIPDQNQKLKFQNQLQAENQMQKMHHKDLAHKAKALLANERNIFKRKEVIKQKKEYGIGSQNSLKSVDNSQSIDKVNDEHLKNRISLFDMDLNQSIQKK